MSKCPCVSDCTACNVQKNPLPLIICISFFQEELEFYLKDGQTLTLSCVWLINAFDLSVIHHTVDIFIHNKSFVCFAVGASAHKNMFFSLEMYKIVHICSLGSMLCLPLISKDSNVY